MEYFVKYVIFKKPSLLLHPVNSSQNSLQLFKKAGFIYNKAHMQSLSRFHRSVHTLEIEWGRWRRRDREERLCLYCDTVTVETEIHALLHCLKYNND